METTQSTFHQRKVEQQAIMALAGCDLETLERLRKDLHQNAEIAFKEIETQRKIKATLLSYGVEEVNIRASAGTGLVVDIFGTGPEISSNTIKCVALRADMDALPIPENNPELPYKTVTPFAHMCGHDGHMVTLLACAQVLSKNRDKLANDQKVRLLFQPAEEGPGGALPMVKDGCLEGVDEVYGYHNFPNFPEGDLRVISGPIMAASTRVKIIVHGKGGYGSVPHMVQDVISAGSAIINNLHVIKSRCIDSKENFIFTLTQFTSGFTYNVFPDQAEMQGTVRTYSDGTKELVKENIKLIAESTAAGLGCSAEVILTDTYPPVVNHVKETEHVIRLGKELLGEERISTTDLPVTASEDFSYFLQEKPGCFYLLGTQKPGEHYSLHTSHYDYNDSMIATGGLLFLRILEDRLGFKCI